MLKNKTSQLNVMKMYKTRLTGYVYLEKKEAYKINFQMFIVLGNEIITLILSQNYDSNISRQLLNSFKTLTILSLIQRSAPLIRTRIQTLSDASTADDFLNIVAKGEFAHNEQFLIQPECLQLYFQLQIYSAFVGVKLEPAHIRTSASE